MSEKLDLLINLLNVCPKCVSGFLHPHTFFREQISGAAIYPPVNIKIYDTNSVLVNVPCTNRECDNSISCKNPFYKAEKCKKDLSSSSEGELELFG